MTGSKDYIRKFFLTTKKKEKKNIRKQKLFNRILTKKKEKPIQLIIFSKHTFSFLITVNIRTQFSYSQVYKRNKYTKVLDIFKNMLE